VRLCRAVVDYIIPVKNYCQQILQLIPKNMEPNVPAVWMLLTQQYQGFASPYQGFAQHRTEGTRPGPAKCGWNEPWEAQPA
jgi:hypothetical protein